MRGRIARAYVQRESENVPYLIGPSGVDAVSDVVAIDQWLALHAPSDGWAT
jgi:hypothetical protein